MRKSLTSFRAAAICLMAVAVAGIVPIYAHAQTSPPEGVLKLPPKTAPKKLPEAPVHPPTAAPQTAVRQVEPFASAPIKSPPAKAAPSLLGHSAPGKATPTKAAPAKTALGKKNTPVVQPPHPGHSDKQPAPASAKPPVKPPAPTAATPAAIGAAAGAAASASVPPPPPAPTSTVETKGTNTGQPLPRWAMLRADKVNMRRGPGTQYPVDWIYYRRNLPVEIEREFDVWRLIKDPSGYEGWVNGAELVGGRGFVVSGQPRTLRDSASEDSSPVAILKPGVIGRIRSCEAGKAWCQMQVGSYRGWLRRDEVFGISPDEAIN